MVFMQRIHPTSDGEKYILKEKFGKNIFSIALGLQLCP